MSRNRSVYKQAFQVEGPFNKSEHTLLREHNVYLAEKRLESANALLQVAARDYAKAFDELLKVRYS